MMMQHASFGVQEASVLVLRETGNGLQQKVS